MKSLFLFFVIATAYPQCSKQKEAEKGPAQIEELRQCYQLITTKTIDSCEYIVAPMIGKTVGLTIVHKANCKNPEHKHPKQ